MTRERIFNKYENLFGAKHKFDEFKKDITALLVGADTEPEKAEKPKYRLLKDLPDAKAGMIFSWDEGGNCYKSEDKHVWVSPHRYHHFTGGTVTQSPDWFEKVEPTVYPEGVLEFKDGDELHECDSDSYYQLWVKDCIDHNYTITRVQNKNGEVFKIGDKVKYQALWKAWCIEKFELTNNVIYAHSEIVNGCKGSYPIDLIHKDILSSGRIYTREEIEVAIKKASKVYENEIYGAMMKGLVTSIINHLKKSLHL